MAGRIVKTASGRVGRTDYSDEPIMVEVAEIENPNEKHLVRKFLVRLDDGTNLICTPGKLEYIGYWD